MSYAQFGEDLVLAERLPEADGFYVDVGCSDPDVNSVTRLFYERGWHGINIDPRADAIARFDERRPRDLNLPLAVGTTEGVCTFWQVTDNPDLSTTHPQTALFLHGEGIAFVATAAPVRPLDDVLATAQVGPIDFVKIDVEGAEPDVLAGFDLSRWQPRVLVIEAVRPLTRIRDDWRWRWRVDRAGYREVAFDGINLFFTSREYSQR